MKKNLNKRVKTGDIIAVELFHNEFGNYEREKKYVFMKAMFDIDKQYRENPNATKQAQGRYTDDTYFTWYRDCFLFQAYEGFYDTPILPSNLKVLVPSIIIGKKQFKDFDWIVVTNEKIDIEQVTFPQCFEVSTNLEYQEVQKGYVAKYKYLWGEIVCKGYFLSQTEREKWTVLSQGISYQWLLIFLRDIIWMQGRKDFLKEKDIEIRKHSYNIEQGFRLGNFVYRPDDRLEIHEFLGLDPTLSYYELAKSKGFDLKKLYE